MSAWKVRTKRFVHLLLAGQNDVAINIYISVYIYVCIHLLSSADNNCALLKLDASLAHWARYAHPRDPAGLLKGVLPLWPARVKGLGN